MKKKNLFVLLFMAMFAFIGNASISTPYPLRTAAAQSLAFSPYVSTQNTTPYTWTVTIAPGTSYETVYSIDPFSSFSGIPIHADLTTGGTYDIRFTTSTPIVYTYGPISAVGPDFNYHQISEGATSYTITGVSFSSGFNFIGIVEI